MLRNVHPEFLITSTRLEPCLMPSLHGRSLCLALGLRDTYYAGIIKVRKTLTEDRSYRHTWA